MNTKNLLSCLPSDQRRPLFYRLLIVWALALPIAVVIWLADKSNGLKHFLDVSIVYTYAISTFTWLLIEVLRIILKGLLSQSVAAKLPSAISAILLLLVGVPLGYWLGLLVGDAYSGLSTRDLWRFNLNRFTGMLLTSVSISIAYVAFFYQFAKAELLAKEATGAKLMLLQSQLEPHMLFNTLAHLRVLIGHDTNKALVMLDHLNSYLRTTLQASRQPFDQPLHTLSEEFSRLREYLSLMSFRMGPRLAFELHLPPELGSSLVPSFILQPLVENAIRHGLEPAVVGGRVEVLASAQGKQLRLTVQDNGCGISELAQAEANLPLLPASSWGLAYVRQRLHTLYGKNTSMHISLVTTGGTCVQLTLPFEKNSSI